MDRFSNAARSPADHQSGTDPLSDVLPTASSTLLDGEEALDNGTKRTLHVFQEKIPRLRWAGLVCLALAVFLHRSLLPGRSGGSLVWFTIGLITFASLSTLVVRMTRAPRLVTRIGQASLMFDLGALLWAVTVTGGSHSLLFWLPLLRVADQSFMGRRWCLLFAHVGSIGLIASFQVQSMLSGIGVDWVVAGFQVGTLWVGGVYLSNASFQAERARQRSARAMRVARDLILRLDRQSADLLESNLEADAASQAKGVFLASMSHELRTPMNAIMGMTDLALDSELTPAQREQLGIVHESAKSLLAILNDILDLSRLEAGKVELVQAQACPADLVEGPARALSLLAHEKGLDLLCEVDPALPATVTCDPGRIHQILTNLLGNAIKFTARGAVSVCVGLTPGGDRLLFEVSDTGKGIAPDRLGRIFESFTQENERVNAEHGGTGLGLAISHKFVRRMGGDLKVESSVGSGSRFWFTIPVVDPQGRLVEEGLDDSIQVIVQTKSKPLGESISRTIARLRALSPGGDSPGVNSQRKATVLILDGPEALETGFAEHADAQRIIVLPRRTECLQSQPIGARSIVQPPCLRDLSQAVLGYRERTDRDQVAEKPGVAPESLRILVAEDNPVNQRVIGAYLERMGHAVEFAADGQEALDAVLSRHFDGVLMDIQMPRMSGLEATRRIRAEIPEDAERPWIVALTAGVLPADRSKCFQAGMNSFLEKPICSRALASELARLSQGGDEPEAAPRPAA